MFSAIAADAANQLSQQELFLWGAVGGLAGFLLAHALPYFTKLMGGGHDNWPPSLPTVLGVAGVVAVNMFMGGIASIVVGEASLVRQAIVFGFSWPAVIKGAGEGLKGLADARDEKLDREG